MSVRPFALRTAAFAMTSAVALVALTGCGDDAEGATDESSSGGSSSSAPADATAPADPDAAEAEISANWAKLFADGDPTALEDGDQLTEAIELLAALAPPPEVKTATVTDVVFTDAETANVTYDFLIDGKPVLPGATGTAVLQDDTWVVSKTTFCTLASLGSPNSPVAGCS
jgi:hypothetical protein